MDDDCTKAMGRFYFSNFRLHFTIQLYTSFACTMRTLRSPHNVELKTPEAKFCLDFDLTCVCVYIPATSFVRINAYVCVREKHVSTSPENRNGASTSSRDFAIYDRRFSSVPRILSVTLCTIISYYFASLRRKRYMYMTRAT